MTWMSRFAFTTASLLSERWEVSEQRMRDLFEAMDSVLRTHPEVGEYNQKI